MNLFWPLKCLLTIKWLSGSEEVALFRGEVALIQRTSGSKSSYYSITGNEIMDTLTIIELLDSMLDYRQDRVKFFFKGHHNKYLHWGLPYNRAEKICLICEQICIPHSYRGIFPKGETNESNPCKSTR